MSKREDSIVLGAIQRVRKAAKKSSLLAFAIGFFCLVIPGLNVTILVIVGGILWPLAEKTGLSLGHASSGFFVPNILGVVVFFVLLWLPVFLLTFISQTVLSASAPDDEKATPAQ